MDSCNSKPIINSARRNLKPAVWKKLPVLILAFCWYHAKCQIKTTPVPDSAHKKETIQWVSFEEADKLLKLKSKKVFISLYTNWCKWCKKMEAEVFSDTAIADYINEFYYAIHFDAEGKADKTFFGQTFSYDPIAKVHGLALALMEGEIGYPVTFILDENLELLQPVRGFVTVNELKPIIKFYGGNSYKTMGWESFQNK